eukprot:13670771-Ditylum_brightwellii.AAC.1
MIDWEGNVMGKTNEMKIILADIPHDEDMASSMMIGSAEVRYMDNLEMDEVVMDAHPEYQMISYDADKVASILGEGSPLCNSQAIYQLLSEGGEINQMPCALGSTTVAQGNILTDHQDFSDSESVTLTNNIHTKDDAMVDQLFSEVISELIDLDDYLVNTAHAKSNMSMNEKHLSPKAARETLNVTTQKRTCVDNPILARNFSTNDKMLRYKRISCYFFMDTFFATKMADNPARSNTCCQLFITDKGFLYAVPLKSKGEVLQAVKQFAKEVGAPDASICDSQPVRTFYNEIGMMLRILEEGTWWANKAEC